MTRRRNHRRNNVKTEARSRGVLDRQSRYGRALRINTHMVESSSFFIEMRRPKNKIKIPREHKTFREFRRTNTTENVLTVLTVRGISSGVVVGNNNNYNVFPIRFPTAARICRRIFATPFFVFRNRNPKNVAVNNNRNVIQQQV